jgi:hypothetical protein
MKAKTLRQGDVLLIPVSKLPANAKQETIVGDLILAFGEVTGHAHRIKEAAKVKAWSAGAERFIQAQEAVALTHEEHDAAVLEPGVIYRQGFQVEDQGAEIRRVQD